MAMYDVTAANARKYYRKCGVPGCHDMECDSDNENERAAVVAFTVAVAAQSQQAAVATRNLGRR